MKKQGFLKAGAFVSALAVSLASCGQGEQSAPGAISNLDVSAYQGATLTTTGATFTAERSGEGQAGVTLRRSAVFVHFTVQGEGARVRIQRGDQSVVSRARADNAVMIGGAGGATSVIVFSPTAAEIAVTVTSVVDCDAAPAGVCRPPVFPAEQPAAGAAAPSAPAASGQTP